MTLVITKTKPKFRETFLPSQGAIVSDGRYEVRLAKTQAEIESALRLRYEVFNVEMSKQKLALDSARLEFDAYDFKCRHLIVIEKSGGKTVGTYRLNSIETAGTSRGFYSYNEFSIEDLPEEVLQHGVEIGRACIATEHRNTKVLFILWKGLATYLKQIGKRYFFGCCSIFTQDESVGERAFRQLERENYIHSAFRVEPRKNGIDLADSGANEKIELPNLFNMYLRIGAKVCGPPMIDHDFGTIDFFVVFDRLSMNDKYHNMFFA